MLILTTPPATEPLTLAEAKAFLRVSDSADDGLITTLISAVRQVAELYCNRAFITQTYRALYDDAPSAPLRLPRPPILTIHAVRVYDAYNTASLLEPSHYTLEADVLMVQNSPLSARAALGFEVEYSAGYGSTAADVPAALKQGMLLHMQQLYSERGEKSSRNGLPAAALALYTPYRVFSCV